MDKGAVCAFVPSSCYWTEAGSAILVAHILMMFNNYSAKTVDLKKTY
jgi:hypothetical protein